jgi:CHAT domain-containing protein
MKTKMVMATKASLKPFILVLLMASLFGCANMPKGIADSLSQVPGLSMFVDMSTLSDMSRRMDEDTISERELRDIMARPIPPPPGSSYELGLLRRILAAFTLADVVEVRRLDDDLRRNSKNVQILEAARGIRIQVEAFSGNFRTAIALANVERLRLNAESRQTGKTSINSTTRVDFFGGAVNLGLNANDPVFLEGLLAEFPGAIDNIATVPLKQRAKYRYYRGVASYGVYVLKGDSVNAKSAIEAAAYEAREKVTLFTPKDEKERREIAEELNDFKPALISAELALGNYARAKELLVDFERTHDKTKRFAHAGFLETSAKYYGFIQDYRRAVEFAKQSNDATTSGHRRFPLIRLLQVLNVTNYQIAAGELTAASQTLDQLLNVNIPETGSGAAGYFASRAYLASKLNSQFVSTVELERFDSFAAKQNGTDSSIIHDGASTIVHESNFRKGGSTQSLAKALAHGRTFSVSLRRLQAAGLNRDLRFPPRLVQEAKVAYLSAASASASNGSGTQQDVLDALTLIQESDTDKDMASAALRQKQIPGVGAEDLRKLQELQIAAREAQKELGNVAQANDAPASELLTLEKKAKDAFQRLETHLDKIQKAAPAFAELLSTDAPTIKEVQSRLSPGEAMAIFVPYAGGTVSAIITKTSFSQRQLPLTATRASDLVNSIRKTVSFEDDVAPFDASAASSLHNELFAWALPQLSSARQLVVVPSGSLASIPFGLLLRGNAASNDYRKMPWLIKSLAITHSPSVGAWLGIGSSGAARSGSFIAWADPEFTNASNAASSGSRSVRKSIRGIAVQPSDGISVPSVLTAASLNGRLERLPETKIEVDAIAKTLRANASNDVISGKLATRSSVLSSSTSGLLSTKSVVMFATHGLAPGQIPGLTQPALAMAAEQNASVIPLLQLDDVIGLRMNADWVILSACNTSAADKAGGDALSGLARGFFFAGAKSLLVTHWEVDSESAAQLTVKTMEKYAANRSMTRAQALQQASIDLIEGKGTNAEWAHPAFWAPYALVGDGRR